MGSIDIILIVITVLVVGIVLRFQFKVFKDTKNKILQLENFFPIESNMEIIKSSITKDILSSKVKLYSFLKNPIPRQYSDQIVTNHINDDDTIVIEEKEEYLDVDLIKIKNARGCEHFMEIVDETNAYLCKNVGTSADFPIIQDICERKIETLEAQISNTINVPLYYGLAGTFIGIIIGLLGIVINAKGLFDGEDTTSLYPLLIGVIIAMFASFVGLFLMIRNSSVNYKKALVNCDKNKNGYYDFIRRELMPVLSNSMASSLNSLKSVLGEFIGKFGHNLDAYANSAELLNDNIEKQHLLLVEINKMDQTKVATQIATTFNTLKDASDSLGIFRTYQNELNNTIQSVDGSVQKIDSIINSFSDFARSLNVVVENQSVAKDLQVQFRTAIEQHFPTGSDARELWRKQFDELIADASKVSEELNSQLKTSTEYIRSFVEDNKSAFDSLSKQNEVLDKLVQYANIQANCYKDLKSEIQDLKKAQLETQSNSTKLNEDLMVAVKEMILAIRTLKN
ncbi:MAG: hypothetical protein IKJ59_07435 [Clostridia bacterium]|nr:hypothetical protein [Bacteroidales bacterium]MBR3918551.1 hypothetical protein [Clostridia bacterium]